MSPQAQRIAIAKACPELVEWHDDKPYWRGQWSTAGEGNEHLAEFDPLNDLNAVQEAELHLLRPHMREQFRINLNEACGFRRAWKDSECDPDIVFAKAPQHLTALLKTLNLWDDSL